MSWKEAEDVYLSNRLLERGQEKGKMLADQGLDYDEFIEKPGSRFKLVFGNVMQSLINIEDEYRKKYPK